MSGRIHRLCPHSRSILDDDPRPYLSLFIETLRIRLLVEVLRLTVQLAFSTRFELILYYARTGLKDR